MSDLSPAVVEINLDGQAVTLQCTLEAAIGVNDHFGGLMNAHQQMLSGHIGAMAVIIRHGGGFEQKQLADLRGKVFRNGAIKLVAPLTSYVTLLMQGGKEAGQDAGQGEGQGADSNDS